MSSEQEDVMLQEDSEDELDWEEVEVPEHQVPHLEITLQTKPKDSGKASANKIKGITHAERLVRIDCHKIHTVALISAARVRNMWINNTLLHARLLSLTPLHLQNAFTAIHKSRIPDQNQRGRMFERAMENLTQWWATSFFQVVPDGHIRNQTFDKIQERLEIRGLHLKNEDDPDEVTLDVETLEDIMGDDAEVIRSSKSLMKHALMRSGSRDTSAQLFTALCRGLGIPARLVVSVQSVPWQAGVGKPKPKYEKKPKGKGKEILHEDDREEVSSSSKWDHMEESGRRLDGGAVPPRSEKSKGKQKAEPVIKLRKTKPQGRTLGKPKLLAPDPLKTPPVYWTEVFSRPDSKWFPIDPIRAFVNKRKVFDPTTASRSTTPQDIRRNPPTKVENRMVYVIAFEEDGYARDVTRRYAKEYGAKVAKVQGGSNAPNVSGGGKARQAWWDKVVHSIERPFRLNRDDLEDQELEAVQMMEGMPSTMSGFKDHPLYVLTRHLKQTETIYPPPPTTPELGKFRGEPVYPRSSVVSLKTAENWMRNAGRSIKSGEQPMKMVKLRPGTVNRMRELEVLKDELNVAGEDSPNGEGASGRDIMQGLYAFSQTEPYVPDPVVDGKIPKNNFGNIDLYVPSMLPKGAAHIPFKGVAKIARKLGFDFAEAVTGFEFKKRRAFPIVEGVVVAAENEEALLEAFWEAEREAEQKARTKREERALKHWQRLIHGLRVRHRIHEQYSKKGHEEKAEANSKDDNEEVVREGSAGPHGDQTDTAGGFLAGADRVVYAFHLPKNTHVVLPSPRNATKVVEEEPIDEDEEPARPMPDFITYDLETMDLDPENMEEVTIPRSSSSPAAENTREHDYVPKTMQQMAEDAAAARQLNGANGGQDGDDGSEEVILTSPPPAAGEKKRTNKVTLTLPARASSTSTPNSLSNTYSLRNRTVSQSGSLTPASTPSASNRKRPRPSATKSKSTPKAKSRSKRAKKQKEVSESEAESVDDDDVNEDEGEDEGEDDDEVMDQLGTSPKKRQRKAKATPVAIAPSTRTLRPRTSKTSAQLEEERRLEEAYRKATIE